MIIYKTTNLINKKIYVGKDSYNNDKYLGSGKFLKLAIKKYGKNNFKKEILQECKSQEELNNAEIYWINELNSRDKKIGYNIALGGDGKCAGTKLSDETKQKISNGQTLEGYIEKYGLIIGTEKYNNKCKKQSLAQIERFKDPNEIVKIINIGNKNGMYGKCHTYDTKQKISKSNTGKKHSIETIELYKITRKGINKGLGYLHVGALNGRAKMWKLISPLNEEFYCKGELNKFCDLHNLNCTLLQRYKNNKIPLDLKIRNLNEKEFIKKQNTLGWSIYEI